MDIKVYLHYICLNYFQNSNYIYLWAFCLLLLSCNNTQREDRYASATSLKQTSIDSLSLNIRRLDTSVNYYVFGIACPSKEQYAACKKINVQLICNGCLQSHQLLSQNNYVDSLIQHYYEYNVLEILK